MTTSPILSSYPFLTLGLQQQAATSNEEMSAMKKINNKIILSGQGGKHCQSQSFDDVDLPDHEILEMYKQHVMRSNST